MRLARITPIAALALALIFIAALPLTARAQTSVSKIAIANPVKIFNELKETQALRAKMEQDLKNLEAARMEKTAALKDLQQARDLLNEGTEMYATSNQRLLEKSVEFETWFRLNQAELQRQQKAQIKSLYDKIIVAVSNHAKSKGIDLVIADQRPELPANLDQVNPDQLRALLGQRNILYNAELTDITAPVIAAMDAASAK